MLSASLKVKVKEKGVQQRRGPITTLGRFPRLEKSSRLWRSSEAEAGLGNCPEDPEGKCKAVRNGPGRGETKVRP